MALFFLAPVVQVLAFAVIVLLIIYSFLDIQVSDIMKFLYDNKIFSLILGYVGSILISLFVVLAEKKKVKNTFKGMLTLSIFMLTWIPINIVCLIKRDYVWEPIEHHRTVEIESIVE